MPRAPRSKPRPQPSILRTSTASRRAGRADNMASSEPLLEWILDPHAPTDLPTNHRDPRTKYHPQPETPLCDHANCPGNCLQYPQRCRHRHCKRNCVLVPSMRIRRQEISNKRMREYNDWDVTDPDLYARVQDGVKKEPRLVPYGEYLATMEAGKKRLALLFVASKHGGDAKHYQDLTLGHTLVDVDVYAWDAQKSMFAVMARETMRYSAYLEKQRKFKNWKAIIVKIKDDFGREKFCKVWGERVDEVIEDSLRDAEEWRYLRGWFV